MPGKVHGSEGHRSKREQHRLHRFSNDAALVRAVGKCDGKSVIPTDTKRNAYIAVENKINGIVG